MQLLDKILYVADYIEARRDKASNLTAMRKLAFEDLDEALYQIMKGTLDYLAKKGSRVDPMTAEAFAFYEDQRKWPVRVAVTLLSAMFIWASSLSPTSYVA